MNGLFYVLVVLEFCLKIAVTPNFSCIFALYIIHLFSSNEGIHTIDATFRFAL